MSFLNSEVDGYIESINAKEVGLLSSQIGAGRKVAGEEIDHGVGIILNKKSGQKVQKGEVLATIYHNDDLEDGYLERFIDAYRFSDNEVEEKTLIYDYIK